jgi:septation ring formation regulator EzrA
VISVLALLALAAQTVSAQGHPFFTNDTMGLVKVIGFIVLPPVALVAYFLARGPNEKIRGVEGDLNGLGRRVDTVERHGLESGTHMSEMILRVVRVEAQLNEQSKAIQKAEARMDGFEKQVIADRRDILNAVSTLGERMTKQLHELDVKVARQGVEHDIREGFEVLGDKIADAVREVRRGNARGGERDD